MDRPRSAWRLDSPVALDRETAQGRAGLPGISLVLNNFAPDEVP